MSMAALSAGERGALKEFDAEASRCDGGVLVVFAGCLPLLLLVGLQSTSGQTSEIAVREISRVRTTAGDQPIELPRGALEVIASIYTIPPGASLPVHKHRHPRYAYVLSGTVQVTAVDGRVFRYTSGEFIVEMVDAWHHGSNTGAEPARLLVIDQVEPGTSNVEVRRP